MSTDRVCLYLPPFAGDYSGVCSALYDLGGMICIHDAAGCTGNYTHFDEPRWYGSDAMVFCTSLRKLDAVLGDDEKMMRRITEAANRLHPRFIAIVGSPVPNVIGFDFQGVANAISARCGIPAFGFATAGIRGSYKDGLVMAVKAVTDYYRKTPVKAACAAGTDSIVLGIPGVSPLDIDQANFNSLTAVLTGAGYVLQREGNNYGSWEQMSHPGKTALNLAWTQAGLELAQYFEKTYGTPYLAGFPAGLSSEADAADYLDALRKVLESGRSDYYRTRPAAAYEGDASKGRALIIQDAIVGSAIADCLAKKGYDCRVFTVSGKTAGMEHFADGYLHHETVILKALSDPQYSLISADPILLDVVPENSTASQLVIPHFAVSSRVGKDRSWNFISTADWSDHFN